MNTFLPKIAAVIDRCSDIAERNHRIFLSIGHQIDSGLFVYNHSPRPLAGGNGTDDSIG